ncbi:MAG: NapH/MauN family ferredoxin-type protein [Magnetovibrio sp.]|nr:NapH/MauN family ferredoxin-type protein [Magnetovibrio sp.]
MFGRSPDKKPDDSAYSEGALEIHLHKRDIKGKKDRVAAIKAERDLNPSTKWRNRRWASIIIINAMFVVSFSLDIQLIEGSLSASRVIGFHFADLNAALQVTLAYKQILINLVIGTVTVLLLWWLLGGRTFCSWVCPYHLLSEFAEKIHVKLTSMKLVRDLPMHRGVRTVLYVIFAGLAFGTGYTVFEAISPVGILSRAMIYGPGLALIWVVLLLGFEVFFTRRAWCRYMCPIGLTYGIVGITSPLHVRYDLEKCLHEGDCRAICLVPHVLEPTKKGFALKEHVILGADCTRCGMCVDVCPTQSLTFDVTGLNKLL